MKLSVIILGGGKGLRFGGGEPKQFRRIRGKSILAHTIEPFLHCPGVMEILLVLPHDRIAGVEDTPGRAGDARVRVVAGGETRQESSAAGVGEASRTATHILIHDAVRPLVSDALLTRLLTALSIHEAVMPVIPVNDTMVRVDRGGLVTEFPGRGEFRRVQTPQGFSAPLIRKVHRFALDGGIKNATDDCSLVQATGLAAVATVEGDVRNLKITSPSDLDMAASWLTQGE